MHTSPRRVPSTTSQPRCCGDCPIPLSPQAPGFSDPQALLSAPLVTRTSTCTPAWAERRPTALVPSPKALRARTTGELLALVRDNWSLRVRESNKPHLTPIPMVAAEL